MATRVEELSLRIEVTDTGAVRVLRQTGEEIKKVEGTAKGAGSGMLKLAAGVATVVGGLAVVRTVVRTAVRELSNVVTEGARMEQQLANVATLLDGDFKTAISDLSTGIRRMITVIPKSPEELGAAAYDIVSAGISRTADTLAVLEASGRLAVAGLSTTKEAAGLLTSALNAFQIPAEKATRVAEVLFLTVKGGKTTVAELAQAFGNVAPIAATAGVRLEELQAATAALTVGGMQTSQAQNSLRQAIVSLLKPTKEMAELLKLTGHETGRALIEAEGLVGAMDALSVAARGNETMLAKAYGSVEAFGTAMAFGSAAGDRFKTIIADIDTNVGAFDRGFERASDTTASRLQLLSNAFAALRLTIFDAIGPTVNVLIDELRRGLDEATNNADGLAATVSAVLVPAILSAARGAAELGNFLAFAFRSKQEGELPFAGFINGISEMNARSAEIQARFDELGVIADRVSRKTADAAEQNYLFAEAVAQIEHAGELSGEALEGLTARMILMDAAGVTLNGTNREAAIRLGLVTEEAKAVEAATTKAAAGVAGAAKETKDALEELNAVAGFRTEGARADLEAAKARLDLIEKEVEAKGEVLGREEEIRRAIEGVVEGERAVLAVTRETATARRSALEGLKEQTDATRAEIDKLGKEINLYDALLGQDAGEEAQRRYQEFLKGVTDDTKKAGKEVATVGKAIAGTIRQLVEDSFSGVILGTRKLSDIFEATRESIVKQMVGGFADIIAEKVTTLDEPLADNVGGLEGVFGTFAKRVGQTFGGMFKLIAGGFGSLSKLFKGGKGLAGIFGGGEAAAGEAGAAGAGATGAEAAGAAGAGEAAGATGAAGLGASLGYAGAAAAILVILTVIGGMLARAFGPKTADEVKKDTRDMLHKLLVKTLEIIDEQALRGVGREKVVSKEVPTLGDRLDEGLPVSNRARVLALLASLGDSPFTKDASKNRRVFSIFGGQIQSILEDFPEQAGDASLAIAQAFSEGLGDAIDKLQEQFLRIVDETRGIDLKTGRPLPAGERELERDRERNPSDRPGRDFGGGPGRDREGALRRSETQAEALQRLIDAGFLLPLKDAISELVGIFSSEMPQAVRNAIPKIVDDAFVLQAEENFRELAGSIFDDLVEAGAAANDRTRRRAERLAAREIEDSGDIGTVSGDQIQRALEVQVEAFGVFGEGLVAAAEKFASGNDIDDALKTFTDSLAAKTQKRAVESITRVFLQTVDVENILGDTFANLEIRAQRILDGFAKGTISSDEAGAAIDELVGTLGTDFEALGRKAEQMGPLIERFAELQERIQLALTTFKQAAEQAGGVVDSIDLLIADLTGDGEAARLEAAVKAAREQQTKALEAAGETLGPALAAIFGIVGKRAREELDFSFEDLGGLDAIRQNIRDLSDEDLKRLVGQFEDLAVAVAARAQAEIAALEKQLAQAEEWASLIDGVRDALQTVELAGLDAFDRGPREFAAGQARFAEALRDFRQGTDAERLAAAQELTQLGPTLLELAEAAGFAPGSPEFEALRESVATALRDVGREASNREAERDAIQDQIAEKQREAAEQLRLLREFTTTTQAELLRRSAEAMAAVADENGPLSDLPKVKETMEKVFDRLDQGINVFQLGAGKAQDDPFAPLGLASGGIVTRREQPAILHGPEAVIPLDRLPELVAKSARASGLDAIQPVRGGGGAGGVEDLVRRLEAAMSRQRPISAQIPISLSYAETFAADTEGDGRRQRHGGDPARDLDRAYEIRRLLFLALRDQATRRELRALLEGVA